MRLSGILLSFVTLITTRAEMVCLEVIRVLESGNG